MTGSVKSDSALLLVDSSNSLRLSLSSSHHVDQDQFFHVESNYDSARPLHKETKSYCSDDDDKEEDSVTKEFGDGRASGGRPVHDSTLPVPISSPTVSYLSSKRRTQQKALNHAAKAKEALRAAIEGELVALLPRPANQISQSAAVRERRDRSKTIQQAGNDENYEKDARDALARLHAMQQVLDAQKRHRKEEGHHGHLVDFLEKPTHHASQSRNGQHDPIRRLHQEKSTTFADPCILAGPDNTGGWLDPLKGTSTNSPQGSGNIVNGETSSTCCSVPGSLGAPPSTRERPAREAAHTPVQYQRRRTRAQKESVKEAHTTLRRLNKERRMALIRQTSHTAIAKHAARQAVQVELRLQHARQILNQKNSGLESHNRIQDRPLPPSVGRSAIQERADTALQNKRHSEVRLLMMKQAVKEAILRTHSHENMARVAQELLSSAARKNWKHRACIQVQSLVRGYLARQTLRRTGTRVLCSSSLLLDDGGTDD
jgi:sulfur relay (sulfurtransferase) complex TusBCD TusD component (DsrE family)